eukprot:3832730-Prorocentrum_lima.AAC.1
MPGFFTAVLKDLPNASSTGPSGWRYEHLSVMAGHGGATALFEAAADLAAGSLAPAARPWLAGARLIALLKDDVPPPAGRVRPIACGEVLRKL